MLTLLFGHWANVAVLNGSQMWDIILRAVQQRGVSEVCKSPMYRPGTQTTPGIFRGCQYRLLAD